MDTGQLGTSFEPVQEEAEKEEKTNNIIIIAVSGCIL